MSEITAATRLCGVIGWPVEHSLSPLMQNAAMEAMGLPWVYVALPVAPERIGEAVRGMRALGIVGLNVTIPHKQAVIEHLDWIDPAARAIGAVNTIHHADGELRGYNTDAYGFTQSIIADGELTFGGATVLILGAGGAARGMAAGAAAEGAKKIILANRTRERAEAIAKDLQAHYPDTAWEVVQASDASLAHAAARSQIVANSTSLGMKATDPLPLPAEAIEPQQVVFDAVYSPPETPLLRAAKDRGAIAVGGLGMLARQGARALAIWSGMEPDEDLMLTVLTRHVREAAARS